jgi:hypothetical protein
LVVFRYLISLRILGLEKAIYDNGESEEERRALAGNKKTLLLKEIDFPGLS